MVQDDELWFPIKDSATGEYVLAQKIASRYGRNRLKTFVDVLNKIIEGAGSPHVIPYSSLRVSLTTGKPLEKRRFKIIAEKLKCDIADIASPEQPTAARESRFSGAQSKQHTLPSINTPIIPRISFVFVIALPKKAWLEKRSRFMSLADEIGRGQYSIASEECLDCKNNS